MSGILDLDQLKTLVAIVEQGGFTRAADAVHKTQSAVSMQMRRLEDRIGKPIFARDGRQSKLTEDGERLLDYARRMVRLNDEAFAVFDEAQLTGRVRFGTPDDYADRFLPNILAMFSRSYPRAEVTVVCSPTDMLINLMEAGELDLAIITQSKQRLPSEFVRREPLLWVGSQRIPAHEIDPLPLALGQPSCCWRQTALESLEVAGRRHRILYSSWNSTAIAAAVLAGLAVSVMPESALRPGMRVLGEAEGFPRLAPCQIGLVRSLRETSAVTDALAGHIVAALDNLSQHYAFAAE